MPDVLKKYADLLTGYCLDLKNGDRFVISSTPLAEPLINEVFCSALEKGAHPELSINLYQTERIFYEKASDFQLKFISPVSRLRTESYTAFLNIKAPYDLHVLESIPSEQIRKRSEAYKDLHTIHMNRAARKEINWTLCSYWTVAAAQEAEMGLEEYRDFILQACCLDKDNPSAHWLNIKKEQKRICNFLNGKELIQYKGKNIDITFSSKGRTWVNSDGKHNMPSGEVFTSPVENSVNGHIRFSYPGIYMGKEIRDIRLEVKNGKVIHAQAARGQELLDELLSIPGASHFGEAAIGTNHGIKKFTKCMLFDEKIGGTIHMALGASYPETGGKNKSGIHWDLLADMKEDSLILADGEEIYRNGKFVI